MCNLSLYFYPPTTTTDLFRAAFPNRIKKKNRVFFFLFFFQKSTVPEQPNHEKKGINHAVRWHLIGIVIMFSDASESVRGRQIECKENGAILSKQEREDQRKCVCVLASTRVRESEREKEWNGEMPASLHRTGSELQNENIACIKSNMKVCGGFFFALV